MGTWCERSCLAVGLALTPRGALHLPLHTHDFEAAIAITSETIFGGASWRALRLQARAARSVPDKKQAFMAWMEAQLMRSVAANGRTGPLAEAAI